MATTANAARFTVSVRGSDVLAWTVGQAGECGRSGSGQQTVEFSDTHPVTVKIARVPSRGGQWLVFGREHGGVMIPSQGTATRTDNTTGSFTYREHCESIPAKDCGTQPLTGFEPSVLSNDHAGFTLTAPYWQYGEPPFHNCIALITPVNLVGNEQPYTGWDFGDQMLTRDEGTMATRPVSPQALRVGRTYHFAAHKVFHLSDGELHGYVISDNGGSGSPDVELGEPEAAQAGDTLGGDRSITDTVSWVVTLKRVS